MPGSPRILYEPDDDLLGFLRSLPAILKSTVEDLTRVGGFGPEFVWPKNFSMYYGVLLQEVLSGAIVAVESLHPRVLVILNRCIFEYSVKSEYLLRNPDVAVKQGNTLPARRYKSAKDAFKNDAAIRRRLEREYQEFRSTSSLSEKAGDVPMADMSERLYGDRQPYIRNFVMGSIFVHGFPEGVVDVIETDRKNNRQYIHFDSAVSNFDALMTNSGYYVLRYVDNVVRHFGLDDRTIRAAREQFAPYLEQYTTLKWT